MQRTLLCVQRSGKDGHETENREHEIVGGSVRRRAGFAFSFSLKISSKQTGRVCGAGAEVVCHNMYDVQFRFRSVHQWRHEGNVDGGDEQGAGSDLCA